MSTPDRRKFVEVRESATTSCGEAIARDDRSFWLAGVVDSVGYYWTRSDSKVRKRATPKPISAPYRAMTPGSRSGSS